MNRTLRTLVVATLALSAVYSARAELRVWTVARTEHVLRGDQPGPEKEAKVAAAKNEWESFQVLVRSDEQVGGIRIEPADLRGPDGALLRGSDAVLYRQHQLELTQGTYRNESFRPDFYPDPLIPVRNPITGEPLSGGRFAAMPFDLEPNQTQGFWVDVHVPRDARAGIYRGEYRLVARGQDEVRIPVQLTVWDFELPDVPTMMTAFGSPAERMRSYYAQREKEGKEPQLKDYAAAEQQCAQLLSDHRINATPPGELLRPVAAGEGKFTIAPDKVKQLRSFIDRYHVNAVQTPHPSSAVKDPVAEAQKLRNWLSAFDEAHRQLDRPKVVFFTYLRDEPNTREDYEYVQKWGGAVREAKSAVKVMVVEQTWTAPGQGGANSEWGDLYGTVDIWCPLFSLHRADSAEKRMALGEQVWTYTALCQGKPTPWWHIDYPLLNYRAPALIAWGQGMSGLLYWGGMSYWRETPDPWLEAPIYTGRGAAQQGRKGIVFNGEGSLVYPARAVGYDGIVPTIRLKALRDGIEDYEYLTLLAARARKEEARQMVARFGPSFFEWEKDAGRWNGGRADLAGLIIEAGKRP